ncbi:MAG: T9SS type A sorting domain-containing protein [Bacteroidales bacterium]|nr:T9SS type A sorting domain-containing protein [Bacteroidales bacterium]
MLVQPKQLTWRLKNPLAWLRCIAVVVLFLAFPLQPLTAQTWTGAVSNSWHVAGNWQPASVPTSNSSVVIKTVANNRYPVISQNVTVKKIELSDWTAGELTVTNGAVLTVSTHFLLKGAAYLLLDNGTLQFNGSGNFNNNSISMPWGASKIEISNNGVLNCPDQLFDIRSEVVMNSGTMNLGSGLTIQNGILFKVVTGNVNVYGASNLDGILDGGAGHFVFNGSPSNSTHQVHIGSDGYFYMSPSSPAIPHADCPPYDPITPRGSVTFNVPAVVAGTGYFYGGDAQIDFYKTAEIQSSAFMYTHNGNVNVHNTLLLSGQGHFSITCKGRLQVDDDAIINGSGSLTVGQGTLDLNGDVTIDWSGTIDAGSGTIEFSGSVFNNTGDFLPGTSTFIVDGTDCTFDSSQWADTIKFYNLVIAEGANSEAFEDVLVLNDLDVGDGGIFEVIEGENLDVIGEITGEGTVESDRPFIHTLLITGPNTIVAIFNEPLNSATALNAANYAIQDVDSSNLDYPTNPILGGANNNEVTLTLGFIIQTDVDYYLVVNNILDLQGTSVNAHHRKRFGKQSDPNEIVWTGAVDSDWGTAGNWSKNYVPTSISLITIPAVTNDPVIGANDEVTIGSSGSLTLEDGATLTLEPGALLTMESESTVSTNSTGLIIISAGADYINRSEGTPTIQLHGEFTGVKGWRMISSPIATSFSNWLKPANNFVTQGFTGALYPAKQPNLLWFDETEVGTTNMAWRQPGNFTDAITTGRGYYFYIFNGAGIITGGTYPDVLPLQMSLQGQETSLTGGVYSYSLSYHERNHSSQTPQNTATYLDLNSDDAGWNLIGNPTASTLNWDDDGWTKTNVDNTLYIWDPSTNQFLTWNGSVGSLTNGLIAPYQAFWVRANNSTPELSFTQDAKSSGATFYKSGFFRKTPELNFTMTLKAQGMNSNVYVSMNEEGIRGADPYDAYRLEPMAEESLEFFTLSSPQHTMPLVINNIPNVVKDQVRIPLYVGAVCEGNQVSSDFTLSWELPVEWPDNLQVILMDNVAQVAIPMNVENSYSFYYRSTKSASIIREEPYLPEQLIKPVPRISSLKSGHPEPFTIVIMRGQPDEDPVYTPPTAQLLPVYPNPMYGQVTVQFTLPERSTVLIQLFDLNGRMIEQVAHSEFAAGLQKLEWNADHLTPGTYIMRLQDKESHSIQKIVKPNSY